MRPYIDLPATSKLFGDFQNITNKTIGVLERVTVIVFNATFNNISVISWRSVLLVEDSGVPGENQRHTYMSQIADKLYHIML